MKICLVAHGYPPELVGGTEKSVQALAHALARQGNEVMVVAGTLECADGFRLSHAQDGPISVHRLHRGDAYFDHWQKSDSVWATDRFRELLVAERPDLVHVHHWIRLSRDLVHAAALEGVPAVVTLHDYWSTCLVTFRVRPARQEFCEVKLGPDPCLACAQELPPRTPWVTRDEQARWFAEHRSDVLRELDLARAVIVPSASHGLAVQRYLGLDAARVPISVVQPGRELSLQRRKPRTPDHKLVLGAWGHLHPIKGQDLIIAAMHRMMHADRIVLRLAGGEPEAGFVARLRAQAVGLDVEFLGAYAVGDLSEHRVSDVDAMINGTRADESWGLIIDEALALGLPSILPRSGAFAERLQEAQGAFFYEPRDADSLAALLDRLVLDRSLLLEARQALPELEQVAPGIDAQLKALRAIYSNAIELGPPRVAEGDSRSGPQRAARQAAWDAGLSACPPADLGFS